jgi:hypothetical protein
MTNKTMKKRGHEKDSSKKEKKEIRVVYLNRVSKERN